MRIIYKIFGIPIIGSRIKTLIANKTGGMFKSQLLRDYTKEQFKVDIGLYSYGACFNADFNNGGSVTIGRYCSFSSNVHYFGAAHPMEYVAMSPYFYNPALSNCVKDVPRAHLKVGNDCWIGFNVIITNNCSKIGNGAVIAAGAVVTKDVPPYSIVAGVPAKVIRYRFDKQTIQMIENSKWWEKTPEECLKYYDYIQLPEEFCRRIENGSK